MNLTRYPALATYAGHYHQLRIPITLGRRTQLTYYIMHDIASVTAHMSFIKRFTFSAGNAFR